MENVSRERTCGSLDELDSCAEKVKSMSVIAELLEDLNRETSGLAKDMSRLHDRLAPVINACPQEELNPPAPNTDSAIGREIASRIADIKKTRNEIDYIISSLEI